MPGKGSNKSLAPSVIHFYVPSSLCCVGTLLIVVKLLIKVNWPMYKCMALDASNLFDSFPRHLYLKGNLSENCYAV